MFRFTIRDLLWLMVVVGIAVSLWQSRTATIHERKHAADWSSKADAAFQAIKARVPAANWDANGVVVVETHENGANYMKVYRSK
jgi:hypothetical protein